jgi:hypothetical protein
VDFPTGSPEERLTGRPRQKREVTPAVPDACPQAQGVDQHIALEQQAAALAEPHIGRPAICAAVSGRMGFEQFNPRDLIPSERAVSAGAAHSLRELGWECTPHPRRDEIPGCRSAYRPVRLGNARPASPERRSPRQNLQG